MNSPFYQYLQAIRGGFKKLTRLDFLNPDGSVKFSIGNRRDRYGETFVQDSGSLTVSIQNGIRRTATVTLANDTGLYEFDVNKIWFGQKVRLLMGLMLPNGQEFYLSMGVFYIKDPGNELIPNSNTVTLELLDKASYLDGTLFGNVADIFEAPKDSLIFDHIKAHLSAPLFEGGTQPIDDIPPVFSDWWNWRTATLANGTNIPYTQISFDYRSEQSGTRWEIIGEMCKLLGALYYYDITGALRIEPSSLDISDASKPILWEFTPTEKEFLGATYVTRSSEVFNCVKAIGESLDANSAVPFAVAKNVDPASPTNIFVIGERWAPTINETGYYTMEALQSLAAWNLKRMSIVQQSVTIRSSQMFHLQENTLITIQRPDRGNQIERHLINGFTIPIGEKGEMSINEKSVMDIPNIQIQSN